MSYDEAYEKGCQRGNEHFFLTRLLSGSFILTYSPWLRSEKYSKFTSGEGFVYQKGDNH